MDGRGRIRNDDPWGWPASTWQALAFLLLGALVLTNAAWFYRGRVAAADAVAVTPPPVPTQIVNVEAIRLRESALADIRARRELGRQMQREVDAERHFPGGKRCIGGQLFATVDGVLRNVGIC